MSVLTVCLIGEEKHKNETQNSFLMVFYFFSSAYEDVEDTMYAVDSDMNQRF